MQIEKLVKLLTESLNSELSDFITPPHNSIKTPTVIYRGELLIEPALTKTVMKFQAEEEFKKHISSNLVLGYTQADAMDQTLILRRLVGPLCFPSPLESYARRKLLDELKNVKSDWIIALGAQANQKIFFYLNFTIPRVKAIYRAELPLNYTPEDKTAYTHKRFTESFKNFLQYFKNLSETPELDWVKITQTSLGYLVILTSKTGLISEQIIEL